MPPKRKAAEAAASEAKSVTCQYPDCGKTFSRTGNLNKHIRSSHEGLKFECEIEGCDKSYTEKTSLERHVSSAHDEIRHACPHSGCTKVYSDRPNLLTHIRSVHKGVKYACPIEDCDKIFSSTNGVNYHVESNHEGARFSCTSCEKVFSSKSGLYKHMKSTHDGVRYFCPFDNCPKVFAGRSGRIKHIDSIHHGIRHFCPFLSCQQTFTQNWDLSRHLKSQHGTAEEEAELLQKKLELQQILAEKEARGLCSASKSCEDPAAAGSFYCFHHQKSVNIITTTLEEQREAGKLSESSIKSSDEFALLLQRSKISIEPTARISLQLLAQGLDDVQSGKAFIIDTEFVWVGRFLPLDITIMRMDGEEIVSTRVDHGMTVEDLQSLCPHPISKCNVRKVYGRSPTTWGKTPNQILKTLQAARIPSDATF